MCKNSQSQTRSGRPRAPPLIQLSLLLLREAAIGYDASCESVQVSLGNGGPLPIPIPTSIPIFHNSTFRAQMKSNLASRLSLSPLFVPASWFALARRWKAHSRCVQNATASFF